VLAEASDGEKTAAAAQAAPAITAVDLRVCRPRPRCSGPTNGAERPSRATAAYGLGRGWAAENAGADRRSAAASCIPWTETRSRRPLRRCCNKIRWPRARRRRRRSRPLSRI